MSGFRLRLKRAPALRVDLRSLSPAVINGSGLAEIEKLGVTHGNQTLPLAELFDIAPGGDDGEWTIDGDLSRFDHLGWQLAGGRIVVGGSVGDYAGGGLSAGALLVKGSAGDLAACEMAGGSLHIEGDVGDFAASTLPGSMDGMRGGCLIVGGSAGERFGDRMRRGTALVFGDVGDFAASRMVAGTIAIGGQVAAHLGYGMRRGSVVLAGPAPGSDWPLSTRSAATFMPALVEPRVFWQLLSRDLARHGGVFATLPRRSMARRLGDVSAGGKGELILAL